MIETFVHFRVKGHSVANDRLFFIKMVLKRILYPDVEDFCSVLLGQSDE